MTAVKENDKASAYKPARTAQACFVPGDHRPLQSSDLLLLRPTALFASKSCCCKTSKASNRFSKTTFNLFSALLFNCIATSAVCTVCFQRCPLLLHPVRPTMFLLKLVLLLYEPENTMHKAISCKFSLNKSFQISCQRGLAILKAENGCRAEHGVDDGLPTTSDHFRLARL